MTVAGRRGDGIGIEIATAALRGVRLDLDVPGRLAVAAEEPITRPGDDALLDAFVRLTARLGGHEGIPTRLAWFPPDAIILTCDATGLMPAEVNRLTGDLDGVTATTSVESGARRWLLAVRWDHERSVRLAGLASSAGLEVEACEPAPIALARVLSSEPTITRRVTDDGCGWDAILADGVPRAAAGSAGSYRRSPDLVADNLRRADLGRLPDDSSQAAGAVRMVIDAMAGDRFQRGGHPAGVALTGDLYPPYPPDDVRSTARQAVALGAAIAAAGLAGRVPRGPAAHRRGHAADRRPPPLGGRTPARRVGARARAQAWWRRLFDRLRPSPDPSDGAALLRRASHRRPRSRDGRTGRREGHRASPRRAVGQCATRPPLTTIVWPETNAESSESR